MFPLVVVEVETVLVGLSEEQFVEGGYVLVGLVEE